MPLLIRNLLVLYADKEHFCCFLLAGGSNAFPVRKMHCFLLLFLVYRELKGEDKMEKNKDWVIFQANQITQDV